MKKLTYKFIKYHFEKEGYTLLSKEYDGCKRKLSYICPNGHAHEITWSCWIRGNRCPYCVKLGKPNISLISNSMASEGYTLLSNEYINAKSKLKVMCNKGHFFYTTWSNWSNTTRPRRCPYCSKRPPIDIDVVKEIIVNNGYELKSNRYINAKYKLHLICPNGHDYHVTWDNWSTKNNRCPICGLGNISKPENYLSGLLADSHVVISNDRYIIAPYELDIVIPDKKIAIEYCGLYWHSELAGKDRNYHLNKLEMCQKKGYKLITILEDEWLLNKDLVILRLKNLLGLSESKIYARKCAVREVSTVEARKFCNENHLQGYNGSKVKLGLFFNDDLVSIMTFAKPSIAKGSKNKEQVIWELQRFCSKINTHIVGGASKLLKYFERNYEWNQILSYADRRWSDGNLYEKLGFAFDGYTKPSYWYFNKQKRIHRFALRKTKDDPKDQTEWEIRKSQGWNRIWDCGNLKFIKINCGVR